MRRSFLTSVIINKMPALSIRIAGHVLTPMGEDEQGRMMILWTNPEGEALTLPAERVQELMAEAFYKVF